MGQTHDEITQNLAERLCWQVARRDDTRVARRLYRKQLVDGVYRLDEGALLDDFFHFLQAVEVMALLEQVHGTAIQREMLPFVQYLLRYGLKTLFGIESMNALPVLLFSDEALMQLVGFNAQQVRQGICQRGATKRQGARTPGPIGPDTLAEQYRQAELAGLGGGVQWGDSGLGEGRGLWREGHGHCGWHRSGDDRALYRRGQVTRKVRIEDKRGRVHEIEVTVYGWKVLLLIDAATKIPLAVKVVKIQEHEALWTRALVTQARMNLAGAARLHKVVFDKGFLAGTDWWWLASRGCALWCRPKTRWR